MLEEKPRKSWATGDTYFGPGNSVHGQSTEKLDKVQSIARRHDLDLNAALSLTGDASRRASKAADKKFLSSLAKHGSFLDWRMYAGQAIGTPLSEAYYNYMRSQDQRREARRENNSENRRARTKVLRDLEDRDL